MLLISMGLGYQRLKQLESGFVDEEGRRFQKKWKVTLLPLVIQEISSSFDVNDETSELMMIGFM